MSANAVRLIPSMGAASLNELRKGLAEVEATAYCFAEMDLDLDFGSRIDFFTSDGDCRNQGYLRAFHGESPVRAASGKDF